MDSTSRLRRHYWLMSLFQGIADHYSRLTRLDCTFVDHEATEDIVSEFVVELDELEAGEDTGEYQ